MTSQVASPLSPPDDWSLLGQSRRQQAERSRAVTFRQHLLNQLPTQVLAKLLPLKGGRPRKDYKLILGVLILQQLQLQWQKVYPIEV